MSRPLSNIRNENTAGAPKLVARFQQMFFHLPVELREIIYDHILPNTLTSTNPLTTKYSHSGPNWSYGILHIKNATRLDAGRYYLRSRLFELPSQGYMPCFERYLSTFPGSDGYEAVRRLHICDTYDLRGEDHMRWSYTDMIVRCTNLRELRVMVESRWILKRHDGACSPRIARHQANPLIPRVSYVIENLRLRELLGLEGIGKFCLWVIVKYPNRVCDIVSLMYDLREWLENEFLGLQKRKIIVELRASGEERLAPRREDMESAV